MLNRRSGIDAPWLRAVGQELARLGDELTRAGPSANEPPSALPERIAAVLRARRLRAIHIGGALFSDPAWDMLLHLMKARLDGEQVFVTGLCAVAAVPATTGLRWIVQLEKKGLIVRRPAAGDRRRVLVELTEPAVARIETYFASLGPAAVGG